MKYNKLINVHCDETDDEQLRFAELLAAEAYMNGIGELQQQAILVLWVPTVIPMPSSYLNF